MYLTFKYKIHFTHPRLTGLNGNHQKWDGDIRRGTQRCLFVTWDARMGTSDSGMGKWGREIEDAGI